MDQRLIKKYFRGQCSGEELEQVLDWFQTKEGREYLEKSIEKDSRQLAEISDYFLYPEVATEQIFSRIQQSKKTAGKKEWIFARVAAVLLAAAVISSVFYWTGKTGLPVVNKITYVSYSTERGQQKILTLSDGSKVRLNEVGRISFPEQFEPDKRKVVLEGEAFFEVAHDAERPFIVSAGKGVIRVLGTKFNVKIDSVSQNIQVAVLEGKVALQKKGTKEGSGALLTRNHFGVLNPLSNEIIIEQIGIGAYLSWMSGRFVFKGEPLWKISRQLERIYNVTIRFGSDRLKELNLTANFERTDLEEVLNIIAGTLEIGFSKNENEVVWQAKDFRERD